MLFDTIAKHEPERFKSIKSWNTDRPGVTMGSYALMHKWRMELDKMAEAAGNVMCLEADGIVVMKPTTATGQAIQRSITRRLTKKPYPQDERVGGHG